MSTITKQDLAKEVAHALACTQAQAKVQVNNFFEKLTLEILKRDSILFSGFGRFNRKMKKSRLGRNPQTGEPMMLDARTVVTFSGTGKYRKQYRKQLNGIIFRHVRVSVEVLYRNDRPRDREAEAAAQAIMTAIANALINGDRVEIRGLGSFEVRWYLGYTGLNPKTGEKVAVGPKKLPFFKPGKELLRRANA